MKHPKGLILIELIMTIVLVGILATFTGFFLYTGFNGYLNAKKTADGALEAQRALDRMTLELRNISYFTSAPTASSISYKNEELAGMRVLEGVGNTIFIRVNGTEYKLLENVSDFSLSVDYADLLNDTTANDVAWIEVGFKVGEIGKRFSTRIFPRNMVQQP